MSDVFDVELSGSHRHFSVAPGETVLAASRRAGLALPYSCLSGRCGSCSARVLSGRWHYPYQPPSALTARERLDHALLCQAVAQSDLQLAIREIDAVAALPIVQRTTRVLSKILLSPEVLELRLGLGEPLRYLPGQYLEFLLPDGKRRPFSIANAPDASGELQLHVRKVAGGGFTQALFEQIAVGSELLIEAPHGTFVPRAGSDRPLIFVAGGTGFAPIKALLEHYCAHDAKREMHLYWGVRVASELYLLPVIHAFQAQVRSLSYLPVLSEQADPASRYGVVHEVVLEEHPNLARYDLYMSGPPAMISAARGAFLAAGLPEERLYYDSFDFAPDVLAKLIQARRAPAFGQTPQ